MKLYHAHIYPMDRAPIENGWVSVENGKITDMGEGEIVPAPEDRDLAGAMLLPGFVDAHTHLGIIENGIGFEGDDCNEASDPFTPQLRAIDGINPMDRCFAEARQRGITAVLSSPGSANACGGTDCRHQNRRPPGGFHADPHRRGEIRSGGEPQIRIQ